MKPAPGNTSGELDGYLDRDSKIKGDLVFEETFRVDGAVDGDIHSSGHLILGEEGVVEGRIQVGQVLVLGQVRGSIVGRESIEIGDTGKIVGDIVTPSLIVAQGGVLQGNCNMPDADLETSTRSFSESKLPVVSRNSA